jgi:hypothetical protein
MRSKANPTGADVAAFLGRQDDTVFVGQCDNVASLVRDLAESYTRGLGFSDDNTVPSDLFAAVLSRAARTAVNPLAYTTESVDTSSVVDRFSGDWSTGERRVLNRYRAKFK